MSEQGRMTISAFIEGLPRLTRWPWFVNKPTLQRRLAHPQRPVAIIWLRWRLCWEEDKGPEVNQTMPGREHCGLKEAGE